MTKLSYMSDPELTKAITELTYPDAEFVISGNEVTGNIMQMRIDNIDIIMPDFTNWNDLMPLVVEHEITLYKYIDSSGWQAFKGSLTDMEITTDNLNPQRALAECLYLVLKEKANAMTETEYLLKGKNGERLRESIKQLEDFPEQKEHLTDPDKE